MTEPGKEAGAGAETGAAGGATASGGAPLLDPSREREARVWDRVARALLVLVLALLVDGAWRVGPTYDEHFYVAAGYAYWQDGDFALNREHPPLAKLMAGFPLLLVPGVVFPERWSELVSYPTTFFYQLNAEHLDRNLFLARLPACLLTAAMVWAVYRVARRRLSPRAGVVALILCGLNPNVIAHGRLAALDMPVAALMFLAATAFLDLLEGPTNARRLGAAVTFGLANLAKFTALVLGPFFVLLAAIACWRRRSVRPFGDLAVVFLAGLTVFAAGYGFEAKSVNEAWSDSKYVIEVAAPDTDDALAPHYLAAVAEEAGLPPKLAARVSGAPDVARAILRLGELASSSAELAGPSLVALGELAALGGDDRRRAFDEVVALDLGFDGRAPAETQAVLEAQRLDVLAALADLRFETLADWRAWHARNRDRSWDRKIFTQGWIERLTRGLFGDDRPIPLFTAWKGIDYQLHHGSIGHGTYFRGRTLTPADFKQGNPSPEYYAVVMAIKNPVAWLVLVALGLALSLARFGDWGPLRWPVFVLLPLGLFLVFSMGNALLGVRYVLPVFPFLAVLGGGVAVRFPRLALGLAFLAALESVWIHPHELMYYNVPAGGPDGGPAISVVGDDWGQDVRALGRFYARHRDEIDAAGGLRYDPYSAGDVAAFGLDRARPVLGRPQGIVAVDAVLYYREQKSYAWLRDYAPFLKLGWSIWLYDTRGGPPGRDPGWR